MMQLYFKNSNIGLYYDSKSCIGKAKWTGHLHGEELRETYLLCLELIDRFALTGWLGDDRQMRDILPADLKWLLEVFTPRLVKSSLRRMARLPSNYENSREAVNEMIIRGHTYEIDLIIRDFADEQEAMDWLLEAVR